jgi:hypothetical protein
MPKARPPFDYPRYAALKEQGLSQRAIAQQMGMAESTLRDNLKMLDKHKEDLPIAEPSPVSSGIPGVHREPFPLGERPQVSLGSPEVYLATLPPDEVADLHAIVTWWRTRQEVAQQPTEKLERATYHVAPKWIAAVRRESDLTGESYATIVNRALAQYFTREGGSIVRKST